MRTAGVQARAAMTRRERVMHDQIGDATPAPLPQAESRRRVLGLAAALTAVAGLAAVTQDDADARRKRHGRKRSHRPGRRKDNRKGKRKGQPPCLVCPEGCAFTSVQAAHDAAQDGDRLILCNGAYTEAVTIQKNVDLVTRAGHQVTLQGTGSGSVVTVQSGTTTTISGRTAISGGTGTLVDGILRGGGILNYGNLTVTGESIVYANSADEGGGIFNGSVASLAITGQFTRVHLNTATSDGAGIYNDGGSTLLIDDAQIHRNTAAGNGGGVFNGRSATVTIQNNAQIYDNTAAQGGGIYTTIGIDTNPGSVTLSDSSVTGNTATNAGGGIFNDGDVVTLKASTVFNNTATVTAGGIFNTEGGVVTLDARSAALDNQPNNCVGTDAC